MIKLFDENRSAADAWTSAIWMVNYPVYVTPLFYHTTGNVLVPANTTTNTGRDGEMLGVAVDIKNTGMTNILTVVSKRYSPPNIARIYTELQLDLTLAINAPTMCYVSESGGVQILQVNLLDYASQYDPSLTCGLELITSVDNTRAIKMVAYPMYPGGIPSLIGGGKVKCAVTPRSTKNTKLVDGQIFSQTIEHVDGIWSTIDAKIIKMSKCTDKAMMTRIIKRAGIPPKQADAHLELIPNCDNLYDFIKQVALFYSDSYKTKTERTITIREKITNQVRLAVDSLK
jgi:hypothetical protein